MSKVVKYFLSQLVYLVTVFLVGLGMLHPYIGAGLVAVNIWWLAR